MIFDTERLQKWAVGMARHVAKLSKDPSTQVGAVIFDDKRRFVAAGYNGLPRGVEDKASRLENREVKYRLTQHAERNALAFATGNVEGGTIVVTHPPCAQCAGAIIQAGIKHVCYPQPSEAMLKRWGEDFDWARIMFKEAGVEVHEW